jgi:hypothetical protein
MSSSAITISAKAMHASKNGYLLMSPMIWNARSAIVLCIRFTALLEFHLRDQASTQLTIDRCDAIHIPHIEIIGDATHEGI